MNIGNFFKIPMNYLHFSRFSLYFGPTMPVRGSCLAHYFLTIWLTIVITRRITSNGSSRLRVGLPTDEINSNTYIAVADQLHNLLLAFGSTGPSEPSPSPLFQPPDHHATTRDDALTCLAGVL
jgi:hypothetical protein